eukprot:scaffold14465_cov239-Ochromonas_danica.AAC.1
MTRGIAHNSNTSSPNGHLSRRSEWSSLPESMSSTTTPRHNWEEYFLESIQEEDDEEETRRKKCCCCFPE